MKPNLNITYRCLLSSFLFLQSVAISAQKDGAWLEKGFISPPAAARPITWWHWTNGNVTKAGITKDLEWMKRTGLAGFQLADVSFGTGQETGKKLLFGTPEWLDALTFAAKEAERLDLEMGIFSSPGWSLAGGPWVKPEQAMKKLVWSETIVQGPRKFSGKLPDPPSCNGPFQDMTYRRNPAAPSPDEEFYRDEAVVAFRTSFMEHQTKTEPPVVNINHQSGNFAKLVDGNLNTGITIEAVDGIAWIQFDFNIPVTIYAVTISAREGIPFGKILTGSDTNDFTTLITLPGAQLYRGGKVRTFAFPETKTRYLSIALEGAPLSPAEVIAQHSVKIPYSFTIAEIAIHQEPRANRWEEKTGFSFLFDYKMVTTPEVHESDVIHAAEVLNLTPFMNADGYLTWEVPEGNWTVLRLGCSLTGAKNRPAVPTGLGYEVDKLNPEHVESYLAGYVKPLEQALDSLFGARLNHFLLDSWEAGMQNWTENMQQEFKRRIGYNPLPYLPVLTGRVVGSSEISDRFLWDFRRTLADMFAENFYGIVTRYLHNSGVKVYGEASGVSLEIPEDALLCKKQVDIPMGEFWFKDLHPSPMYHVDIRGAASASHVYGKTLVAAEAFTGGNFESPYALKKLSDYWFTQGVNKIVFHTSAHQPLDTKPGNTMVGTHFNRNITWAELAAPFVNYLSRCSYMLQQGLFAADIAYLLDEGAPSTMPFWGSGLQPEPPEGYDYDYINSDVLLNLMSVSDNGKLMLPGGMTYSLLVLPLNNRMTLPVLKKINELVRSGAVIVGPKPVASPSLAGYPQVDKEIQALAETLWSDLDGISRTVRFAGKGMVAWGEPPVKILERLKISRDVEFTKNLDTKINWIHRKTNDADFYYISSQNDFPQQVEFRFRITGKEAEIWYPQDGSVKPASYLIKEGKTIVSVKMEKFESFFMVFSKPAADSMRIIPEMQETELLDISENWEVHFSEISGTSKKIEFRHLVDWTQHPDSGVKFFSGTADYLKTFRLQKKWLVQGNRVIIDLGKVKDIAEVTLNGENTALLWKEPYRADITSLLMPGINTLEIKITNQWTNRLYGDQQASDVKKVLDAFIPKFGGQWEPVESGLTGPVRIISHRNCQ